MSGRSSPIAARRGFMRRAAGLALAPAALPVLPAFAAAGPAAGSAAPPQVSPLGRWLTGASGLPAYEYLGPLPAAARNLQGGDALLPEDPPFILGNYRMTAFVHASGVVQMLSGERAWARTNAAADQLNYGDNSATLSVNRPGASRPGRSWPLLGVGALAADPARCKRVFGVGYASFDYQPEDGIACQRVLSVRPSTQVGEGNASLLVSVTLTNRGGHALACAYEESYANRYVPAGEQKLAPEQRRLRYTPQARLAGDGRTAITTYKVTPNRFLLAPAPQQSSPMDVQPPAVFLQLRPTATSLRGCVQASPDALKAMLKATLAPGQSVTFELVYGICHDGTDGVAAQADALFAGIGELRVPAAGGSFMSQWRARLPTFPDEDDAVLRTEMPWHAYVLESMATYSAYFKETYVPQGMLYTYHDGENISNRDHLQAVLPLCYSNPALAKSCLRYVLKHTTWLGEVKRGTGGFGYVEPAVYKESDEQLYLFMAIGEYLHLNGDHAFLDETLEHYPVEDARTSTVMTMLKKHFIYLRDSVALGEHGLIRILNSDWSDSFFHQYSPNVTEVFAESVLNSAMALAVMPRLIEQLRPHAGQPFLAALEEYHANLLRAFMTDLGERNYAARAYLNDGKPSFGLDRVCLEPQGFLLQIPSLPLERKRQIYATVRQAVYAPEKVGFRIRERPLWGAPEGEDGAIWPALQGQVVAALTSFDPAEARRVLHATSLHQFARHYPQFWAGQWTHSDNYGSTLSSREGVFQWWQGPFKQVFQGYCSHVHAWPLYCYYKLQKKHQ